MSASQFGSKAANDLTSAVHATGADLQRLKTLAGRRVSAENSFVTDSAWMQSS
jgi:hypothetical protein